MKVSKYIITSIFFVLLFRFAQAQSISWKQSEFPSSVSQVTTILSQNESIYPGTKSSGLYISSDNGKSFSKITPGLTSINKLSATLNGNLFAVGGGGFARSESKGYNWSYYNSNPGIFYNLMNNSICTLGNLVITGGDSYPDYSAEIVRSSDGGNTWIEVYSIPGNYNQESYNVITLATSKNGTMLGCLKHGVLQNTHFPTTVYSYGIIRSTDYGATWDTVSSNFQIPPQIFDFAWNSKNEVFAASNQGILQSKDNGITWSFAPGPLPTINVQCIAIKSYDDIYIGTGDAGVFISTDDGNSWEAMNQGLTDSVVNAISIGQDGYLYAGTNYSGVYRSNEIIDSIRISTGDSVPVIIPDQYILSQNYPNPFNPSTIINYGIPKSGFVILKVYDMLGKEVKTLVNEEKPPGSYSVNFDGKNLSSGIYFYRIAIRPRSGEFSSDKIQAGNYSSVKKMVLIK